MEYLTTHDLVWINTSITGGVSPYNYVTLEAAMAGQYSYGESDDVPGQAAVLLSKLIKSAPFGKGNRRTALIATLSFLKSNGYVSRISDEDSAAVVLDVADGKLTAAEAVARLSEPGESTAPSRLTLRKLITHECNDRREALALLAAGD